MEWQIWLISGKSRQDGGTTRRQFRGDDESVWQTSYTWFVSEVDLTVEHARTKAKAFYKGCKKDGQYRIDISTMDDIFTVVDKALTWHYDGREDIRIDLEIYAVPKPAPPPSGQPPPGSAAPPGTGRNTSTLRQTAAGLNWIEDAEARSDMAATLRQKWACSVAACPNHSKGGCCYWRSSNCADGHYPLGKETL